MLFQNTVEFTHVALRLVPEVLNSVDVIGSVCKHSGGVDTQMFELRNIQPVIASKAVSIYNTVRHTLSLISGHNVADNASGMILV